MRGRGGGRRRRRRRKKKKSSSNNKQWATIYETTVSSDLTSSNCECVWLTLTLGEQSVPK